MRARLSPAEIDAARAVATRDRRELIIEQAVDELIRRIHMMLTGQPTATDAQVQILIHLGMLAIARAADELGVAAPNARQVLTRLRGGRL